MRTDKYLQDYKYIYNASVFHDDNFNGGKLDSDWAHQFARIYFALKNPEGASRAQIQEFMDGWFEFWNHMFD